MNNVEKKFNIAREKAEIALFNVKKHLKKYGEQMELQNRCIMMACRDDLICKLAYLDRLIAAARDGKIVNGDSIE